MPAVALAFRVTLVDVSVVQLTPSPECCAVNVFPTRVNRTQRGGNTGLTQPVTLMVVAPVVGRTWRLMPLVGVSSTAAWAEFAATLLRIMTPAFANAWVCWTF